MTGRSVHGRARRAARSATSAMSVNVSSRIASGVSAASARDLLGEQREDLVERRGAERLHARARSGRCRRARAARRRARAQPHAARLSSSTWSPRPYSSSFGRASRRRCWSMMQSAPAMHVVARACSSTISGFGDVELLGALLRRHAGALQHRPHRPVEDEHLSPSLIRMSGIVSRRSSPVAARTRASSARASRRLERQRDRAPRTGRPRTPRSRRTCPCRTRASSPSSSVSAPGLAHRRAQPAHHAALVVERDVARRLAHGEPLAPRGTRSPRVDVLLAPGDLDQHAALLARLDLRAQDVGDEVVVLHEVVDDRLERLPRREREVESLARPCQIASSVRISSGLIACAPGCGSSSSGGASVKPRSATHSLSSVGDPRAPSAAS